VTILLDLAHPEQLDRVIKCFRKGEPVALPTETVYGLAAPLDNEAAIAKVFKLKARPYFNPLIVHVLDWEQASRYVLEAPSIAEKLARKFWPGPLSLLLKKTPLVPDLCTNASSWVALRAPRHPHFRSVLTRLAVPIVAPSANRYTQVSPVAALDVIEELGPYGLEAVVEGGRSELGLESTIAQIVSETEIQILRPGALSVEAIRRVVGSEVRIQTIKKTEDIIAPGMIARHYSPQIPLYFVESQEDLMNLAHLNFKDALLLRVFSKDAPWLKGDSFKREIVLSPEASDIVAASRLYRSLRDLKASDAAFVVALKSQDDGLGLAINDRLRRAAGRVANPNS
jgi:L-threonylcarbamoyladenylate synthase